MKSLLQLSRISFLVAIGLSMASCGATARLNAVPHANESEATVLNLPAARSWEDNLSPAFMQEVARAGVLEPAIEAFRTSGTPLPPANYLVISGGGADGAVYGAGLLCGWTAAGTRPEFKLVTGISTGALTAPFAFLGPKYDAKMKSLYTTIKTADLLKSRGMLAAIFDDSLMSTDGLGKLIVKTFDDEMLKDIAAEYAKGRFLMILTTNLDSGRAMIWNIGLIASSGDKNAATIIHKVLRASAAIPAAFPPEMIDVEFNGKKYQEMHVDGGATAQLFLYPPEYRLRDEAKAMGVVRERRAYIIRNSRVDSAWSQVQRKTLSIAGRAISALIQNSGVGDLYRVFVICRRDGVDYNLAYIPKTFDLVPKEDFDPVYMSKLFELGYQSSIHGEQWAKFPPELAVDPNDPRFKTPTN